MNQGSHIVDPLGSSERPRGESGGEQLPMDKGMHHPIVADLVQAIQEDREPAVNGREGLRSLRVIEAIYTSARQQGELLLG